MLGIVAIDNRVRKLLELEAKKKELEAMAEALKDELKADMEEKGVDMLETKNHVVRWKDIETNRFDGKTFKVEHPEMYKEYLVKNVNKRFTVA